MADIEFSKELFAEGFGHFPVDSADDLAKAIRLLRAAIKADPANGFVHAALAYAYLVMWQGRWRLEPAIPVDKALADALIHCENGISLNGQSHDSWWGCAWYYVATAKRYESREQREWYYKVARRRINAAQALTPGNDRFFVAERATIRLNLGPAKGEDIDEIVAILEGLKKPKRWMIWSLAEALYVRAGRKGSTNDYEAARRAADRALENWSPEQGHLVDAWLLKATCHAQLGEDAEATNALKTFASAIADRGSKSEPWDVADERRAVSFAKSKDLRHWILGMRKVREISATNAGLLRDASGLCQKPDAWWDQYDHDTSWPDPSAEWEEPRP